ncbi:ErmE/ErmH/ErmO/ErmR family 23S rRNA (adenine(2058)-N(6))-methyltransferase [Actinomadura sp. NBRC 104425]|uniref:ErmE/ErmH/ErmO/ErmR family 23S rRNA (adenine(2058)-N(6))-methyltransferase n=1 Tax=Actinomadura sp. NBRC 104425 TaxID=3032204 RepID=UPI002552B07B|nr:ErmE/ErmH/ErmO/ErmR family 23S rRNA (adenine(2058)-N(6))-methyltransferase [Actinomadura sp. NBRC 104425]
MRPASQPSRSGRDRARRFLSQNFLADPRAIGSIVRSVAARPGDLVVEVGAGDGRVTAALAAGDAHVIAYEIDPVLAGRARRRCADLPNVRVVRGDFLRARPPRGPFAVAGNIPYSLTSPIVQWCLRAPRLTSATLVTQLEYARKRTGDYGRWSLVTVRSWPLLEWRLGERIGRELFRPVPRVDSAILRLVRRPRPLLPASALADYERCVALGFRGEGGTLRASLRREHPRGRVDTALHAAGVERDAVVAFVHPDQWVRLFRVLYGLPSARARAGTSRQP